MAEEDSETGDPETGTFERDDPPLGVLDGVESELPPPPEPTEEVLDLPEWMTKPAPGSPAAVEAALLSDPDDADGSDVLLPVRAAAPGNRRVDNTSTAIGALSMRIDSLIAATTTYRSVLSDRLAEYADLVSRLNRTQATDLDEFRKANERTVGEIRRTMADAEEALRGVSGQSDQLVTDMGLLADFVRRNSADSRELIEATDKLGRFVTGSLDQFAERVLGELRSFSDNVLPELNTLRAELALARESIDDLNERASSAPVRSAIDELRADFSGLRRAVLEWPDLEVARAEIVAMRADLSELIEEFHDQPPPPPPPEPPVPVDVDAIVTSTAEGVAEQIAALRDELRDELRDLAVQVAAVAEREIPAPLPPLPSGEVSDAAIEALREEIVALRRRIKVRAPD